jgi:hypothetical protein
MGVYNPTVNQGIDLIFTTTNTDANNTPINITGFTLRLAISNQVTGVTVLTLTNGSGVTLTNPTGGVATFQITGAQTAAIPTGTYYYGIKATSAGGINYDWADGLITIAQARV